jgi:hypothetical protein
MTLVGNAMREGFIASLKRSMIIFEISYILEIVTQNDLRLPWQRFGFWSWARKENPWAAGICLRFYILLQKTIFWAHCESEEIRNDFSNQLHIGKWNRSTDDHDDDDDDEDDAVMITMIFLKKRFKKKKSLS